MTRWSSHSEDMLQVALDDVDWDMLRASSSDVSEFTDVALSFVNTLTEQATETVTKMTFSNQKPWVDRSIRDAVNHRTAAYNTGLLSGNMSEYKASCYALRRAVKSYHRIGGQGSEGTKESERQKAAGPDGIPSCVLRSCADQLAGLFTSIFNDFFATSVVPTPFKKYVIIPVPKNSKPSCLNDYRPVALTLTVMKIFAPHLLLHPCYFGPSLVCLPPK